MTDWRQNRVQDFVVAIAAVAGVTGVRVLLGRIAVLDETPFLLYTLAVLLSGWFGGFWPAMVAALLSAAAIDYFFLPPLYTFTYRNQHDWVPLLVFAMEGIAVGLLAGARRKALRLLQAEKEQLEHRVASRPEQLQGMNRSLNEQIGENERKTKVLQEFAEKLEVSNRELEDFASVASHDLQEPLRKIQAFGDRLRTKAWEQMGEDGRDYLDRMLKAAGRMQVLINDLLTFSRVTTKAEPFRRIDLNRLMRDVLADLEARVETTGGRVEVGALPEIEADETQMRQLLQNLVSNGLKFHRPGVPPVVRVSAAVSNGALPKVAEIRVEDNGIGFDEKYLDRIFNIFQRLHGRGEYEGTGIGLAVCRKIVERHGGTIAAASTPGKGAAFTCRLPVEQPEEKKANA